MQSSFIKNGFSVYRVPESVIDTVARSFVYRLNARFQKYKPSLKYVGDHGAFAEIIDEIDDRIWHDCFGIVSYRMLDREAVEIVQDWIGTAILDTFPGSNYRFHHVTDSDVLNNELVSSRDLSMYYRVVRPYKRSDVGFPHRDCDFWDSSITALPYVGNNPERLKIWFPIWGFTRKNSLHVIAGSHHEEITPVYISIGGLKKPTIEEDFLNLHSDSITVPISSPLEAIVFHDKLVHWGPMNSDLGTIRVSVEGTLINSHARR